VPVNWNVFEKNVVQNLVVREVLDLGNAAGDV
jgi:hypothetical protein